jgi:hypothetical protein
MTARTRKPGKEARGVRVELGEIAFTLILLGLITFRGRKVNAHGIHESPPSANGQG